jgi:hypothetical protein
MKIMNIKKAITTALIVYAIIFLIASVIMLVVKDQNIFGFITMIIALSAAFIISYTYYFAGSRITRPIKEGMQLWIIMIIIMFAIEVPVMAYGFAAQQGLAYFMSWHIIAGYILIAAMTTLAAYLASRRDKQTIL